MSEKWLQWKPIANLEDKYFIESICEMPDGLHICFQPSARNSNGKKLKFFFAGSVTAFCIADEVCRIETISDLNHAYGGNFYSQWTFFKVEYSSYLKWLSEQSCSITDTFKLQHICCITDDSILDIATRNEPQILFIESNV